MLRGTKRKGYLHETASGLRTPALVISAVPKRKTSLAKWPRAMMNDQIVVRYILQIH